MSTAIDFNKKSFVLITGASQGIGQKIAEVIGSKLKEGSKIVLIARSEKGLTETKEKVYTTNKNLSIETFSLDLSKPDVEDYETIFNKLLQEGDSYEIGIIFHNAGQIGELKDALKFNDLNMWRSYYDLNLFSTTLLNSVFITKCKKYTSKFCMINITSLCGRKPYSNLALYGSAKAARDLYFSVIAVEHPDIIVLQYSPGPVDTAMFNEVIETAEDPQLKTQFKEMRDKKIVLTTDQTIAKLFMLLENGKFKSGDVIDYFDV